MMLDPVTDMVAHMIGLFQVSLEENRARNDFKKFDALRPRDPQIDPLSEADVKLKTVYQLDGFTPGIKYLEAPEDHARPVPDYFISPTYIPVWGPLLPLADAPLYPFHQVSSGFSQGSIHLTLEPPGSIAVIVYQHNYLMDNDLLRLSETQTAFLDPVYHDIQLQDYFVIAQEITPFMDKNIPESGQETHDYAINLYHKMSEATDINPTGAIVHLQSGAEAYGAYENGISVETMTKLEDVMPAFFQKDDDITDEGGEPLWAPGPFKDLDGANNITDPFIPDPGHEVVSGANVMVNQTSISFSWLDAPVIAVMGDVVNLNLIVQSNMLIENDQFGSTVTATGSATYNSASLSLQSSALEGQVEVGDGHSLSSNWVVTRVEGDLLTLNYVHQYSFLTDFDRADITFRSSNSFIDLGDNNLVNITNLAELGFGYDLIIIGGHMFTINQISQMNVLLDSDHVTYSGMQPTDFSAGDNLLFNGASISVIGIDSHIQMQDSFANAAHDLGQGELTIDESVAHDSVFEGVEILRVLYVSGDVVTINRVDQTNVLGDSDQVHLALDNFQDATNASVSITTGSNVAANLASISQYGLDSTVMVGGETYDDALIYQAGFIDTAADPSGVSLPPLANEAVAFLAADMVGPDAIDGSGLVMTASEDAGSSPDLMQTMLA